METCLMIKSYTRDFRQDKRSKGLIFFSDESTDIACFKNSLGIREDLYAVFGLENKNGYLNEINELILTLPSDVLALIEIIVSWLDKKRWNKNGYSTIKYKKAKKVLKKVLQNLVIIYGIMLLDKNVYLILYDR